MKEKDIGQNEEIEFPLYHGMRTKKSPEQIKKEGFCSYGTHIDEKKKIIDALKYFGKEKTITSKHRRGGLVKGIINEVSGSFEKFRLNTYATTTPEASCNWWARANPEHISLSLHYLGINDDKIDKYLKEKFGNNCVRVELKMTSKGEESNFNTGLNCIPPNLIKDVKKCKSCDYTGTEKRDNL
jgi:hypothetical protein